MYARWTISTIRQLSMTVLLCSACKRYWAGASAGAAAGFLRLGRIGLRSGFGGGGGGCNSATTGFGEVRYVSEANMPPESLIIDTGMLAGCRPGIE